MGGPVSEHAEAHGFVIVSKNPTFIGAALYLVNC
jgi:hypothetical protein